MKRLLSLILAVVICFSLTACGGESKKKKTNNEVTEVTFPLEEQVTFTFMLDGTESVSFANDIANNALWKKLEEDTNVHIDFQFLGDNPSEKLSLLVNGDNYGDVLWGGPIIEAVEASKYIAAEIFVDLTDYINEDLMPNFSADLKENPNLLYNCIASDGGIYTMPNVEGTEGSFLESPIWVNKAWLDKLGLGIPTTLDEFTNMLRAFATKDPNGNGLADEIPYICRTGSAYSHTEALLGLWGISTKDGTNDAFVQLVDGKVRFVPTTEAYKAAVEYMAMLYKEGLMWAECFTATETQMNAKTNSEIPLVGCFTSTQPATTAYKNDYVCIAPPKVEGYEPCWYYHPGYNGTANQFFVTDKCENVSVLMAWLDNFYDFEVSLKASLGEVSDGRLTINDSGKYERIELNVEENAKLNKENPTLSYLFGAFITSFTKNDFETKFELDNSRTIYQSNYEIYKDYITDEAWPRPYMLPEDAYDASIYKTDIEYEVTVKRASWITGKGDINAEWDAYLKKLKSIGLEEYVAMQQRAYDAKQEHVK